MATANKQPTTSLENKVKDLEKRVKTLEEARLQLPGREDLDQTRTKLTTWAKKNPMGALGIALLVGLLIGAILG